jgi:O-antigen/teichoic acid export membrane protein
MGPDGIGQVQFFTSIISYVSLFVGLGIPLYAVREIARVRNDKEVMVKTLEEIFLLHLMLTAVGYFVMIVMCLTIPQINSELSLFLLMSLSVIFTTIGCEWFYQGIEDFKYITTRAIMVRIVCIILLFLLVKTKDDLLWYGFYGVMGTVGNNVFNFVRLRRYINGYYIKFKALKPFRHLKTISSVFLLTILSTIYISLNSVILGFLCGNESVGYYTSGVKLFTLTFTLVYSLTTIIIPHMSNLIAEHRDDEVRVMSQKLYRVVVGIGLPMAVILYYVSPSAVILLCGLEFEPSITVSQIVSPLLLVVGLSSVFGMQILYPMGHVKIMIRATVIASVVDLTIIFILAPYLAQDAAAWGYLTAEIAATVSEYCFGRRYIPIRIFDKSLGTYIWGSIVLSISLIFISQCIHGLSNILMMCVLVLTSIIVYLGFLLYRQDQLFIQLMGQMKSILIKK